MKNSKLTGLLPSAFSHINLRLKEKYVLFTELQNYNSELIDCNIKIKYYKICICVIYTKNLLIF